MNQPANQTKRDLMVLGLVIGLLKAKGASVANIVIFLTAWACIKIPQEMVEWQFLGFKFMLLRLALTIVAAFLMGTIIEFILTKKMER